MPALSDASGEHVPAPPLLPPELPILQQRWSLGDSSSSEPSNRPARFAPHTPGQGEPVPGEPQPASGADSAAYRNISWGFSRLSCPALWTELCPCRCSIHQQNIWHDALSCSSQATLLCVFLEPLLSRSCFTHCPAEATNTSTAAAQASAFSSTKNNAEYSF